jgi:hypothetical protein
MRLPDDSIGISDLNDYLACPRRTEFKLRRFTEGKEPPEARGKAGVRDPTSAYGSAIHDAIFLIEEEAYRPDEAAEAAFQKWAQWLEPSDLKHLEDDLATYLRRDVRGVETVVNEGEFKVPLLVYEERTIYFRFKVDRLYRRLDAPTQFVHIDYKSSKWLKSKQEVHDDRQLWAYNFGLHEVFPEMTDLLQVYDQLLGGQETTRKNAAHRAQIKRWLQQVALKALRDDKLEPTWNDFCAWCPIMMDCPEVDRLSQFALDEIAVLERPKKKADGSPGKRKEMVLDPDRFQEYTAKLPKVVAALRVLEKFKDTVNDDLRNMPDERRAQNGFELKPGKRMTSYPPDMLKVLYEEELGDRAFELAKVTKTAIDDVLDAEGDARALAVIDSMKIEGRADPSPVPIQ